MSCARRLCDCRGGRTATASNPPTVSADTVAAARLSLAQMGISPADLVAPGTTTPTFAEVIPKARARLSPGTLQPTTPTSSSYQVRLSSVDCRCSAVCFGVTAPWIVDDRVVGRDRTATSGPGAGDTGPARMDDRLVLQGILFVLLTGIGREDLPQELGFGTGMTCWRRLRDCRRGGSRPCT
ncbi:transposase [Nocardia farcinica]